jgi:hypothetical protein
MGDEDCCVLGVLPNLLQEITIVSIISCISGFSVSFVSLWEIESKEIQENELNK